LTGSIPDFSSNTALNKFYLNGNQLSDPAGWKADTSNYPPGCTVIV